MSERCRLTGSDGQTGRAPRWWEKLIPQVGIHTPWFYRSHRVVLLFWLGRVFVLWKSKLP